MGGLRLLFVLLLSIQTLSVPVVEEEILPDNGDDSVLSDIYKVNKDLDINLFESDINLELIAKGDEGVVGDEGLARDKRNAARDRKKLWASRTVPYEYSAGLPSNYRQIIQDAMAEYHNHTCLRFKERTTENQWIEFVYKIGCWSAVGRQYWLHKFGQEVSIGKGCNNKGTVMHEIMHAIGFWHEQSRPDRNQYVEVLWENIEDGEAYNFNKYSHGEIDTLQIPYDFDSIMHYGTRSFSKNGEPTIRAVKDSSRSLGQRGGFTDMDIREINALYNCGNKDSPWSDWSNFGPCSLDCKKLRQRFCSSSDQVRDCSEADKYGVQTETAECTMEECNAAVDGNWGRWSSWGSCSSSCGFGTHNRTRKCQDPSPQNGGKDCVGSAISNTECKLKSCGIGSDDCEFDHDKFCYWTNDVTNSEYFDWMRNTGMTASRGTGPSKDHSSGSGYYMYVESSTPAEPGDQSRLLSKTFAATNGRCMSFWYHMYGSGIGELSVSVQQINPNARHTVWSMSGEQGDEWKRAQVTIESGSEYQVIFEAVRGGDYRGDIALDDVRFVERPCLEPIGCYRDRGSSRSLSIFLKSYRGHIDWYNMDKTINRCANIVQKAGYKLFGVQFYGECWVGNPSDQYDRYGYDPSKCWDGVGKHWANFVYKIV